MSRYKDVNKAINDFQDFLFDGSMNLDETIEEIIDETHLLEGEDGSINLDECSVDWAGKDICSLDTLIRLYTMLLLQRVCNAAETFKIK